MNFSEWWEDTFGFSIGWSGDDWHSSNTDFYDYSGRDSTWDSSRYDRDAWDDSSSFSKNHSTELRFALTVNF